MNDNILKIQSCWKSFYCRKKIKIFSKLPDDIWNLVLEKIYEKNIYFYIFENILFIRLTKLYWAPPINKLKIKLKTIDLVRKNHTILKKYTVQKALDLSLRLLQYNITPTFSYFLNGCIEDLLKSSSLQTNIY